MPQREFSEDESQTRHPSASASKPEYVRSLIRDSSIGDGKCFAGVAPKAHIQHSSAVFYAFPSAASSQNRRRASAAAPPSGAKMSGTLSKSGKKSP
jgi:hypothetical protein